MQKIGVWIADHDGALIVSKIELFWQDGSRGSTGEDTSGKLYTHKFAEDEIITEFTIHAGSFVDGISFKTNKLASEFAARGPGGTAHQIDVGNGKLLGFTGRSGYDIDAISAGFN